VWSRLDNCSSQETLSPAWSAVLFEARLKTLDCASFQAEHSL